MRFLALALLIVSGACSKTGPAPDDDTAARADGGARGDGALVAALLIEDGTYNSELTAPMDILHHTPFHAPPGIRVVTVARTMEPIRTFEGLVIEPDYDYATAPPIDILVVPSAERHVSPEFDDPALIGFVRERAETAKWVMSLCDGAFVLGRAGVLDGRTCTTFPGDLSALRARFPAANVIDGVTFVVDGKVVTGVGGARSFEPALWLVERLFGETPALGVARGMVIDWNVDAVPHVEVDAALPVGNGYAPNAVIDPAVIVVDEEGAPHRLLELAGEGDRVIVLFLFGGGDAKGDARRAGLWCEDSMNEMPLLRHLTHRFAEAGVTFVPVACPPVFHEERFGYSTGAFAERGDGDEVARFVASTERAIETGVLPFEQVFYDPAFLLSRDVLRLPAAPDAPAWVGRFRPVDEWQTYGTPCLWILSRDGRVLMPPFHGNNYEADGVLRYTPRELGFAIERALRITEEGE